AASAVTGSLLLAVFFAIFPGSIASPYAAGDPLVGTRWLYRGSQPSASRMCFILAPERILVIHAFLLLTLILAAVATRRTAPEFRFRWILALTMLAATFAVGLWQMRGAAAATMMAAPIFVASLAPLLPDLERRRLLLAAVLVSPAVLAVPAMARRPLIDMIHPPTRIIAKEDHVSTCRAASSLAPLLSLPRGRV